MKRLTVCVGDDLTKDSIFETLNAISQKIVTELNWDKNSFKVSHELYENGIVEYQCYYPESLNKNKAQKALTSIGLIYNV